MFSDSWSTKFARSSSSNQWRWRRREFDIVLSQIQLILYAQPNAKESKMHNTEVKTDIVIQQHQDQLPHHSQTSGKFLMLFEGKFVKLWNSIGRYLHKSLEILIIVIIVTIDMICWLSFLFNNNKSKIWEPKGSTNWGKYNLYQIPYSHEI